MFRKSRLLAIAFGATAIASAAEVVRADVPRPDRARIMAIGTVAQTVTPGAKVSINPQPLPPRIQQEEARIATGSSMGPGSRVMINPQPLPPKQQNGAHGIR